MKSKLLALLLVASSAFGAHVEGRKIQATDIVDAAGISVFSFPTTHPTAGRVCTFNGDGEATSSSVTEAQLLASILPDQSGNSGKYLTTNGTSTSWASVNSAVWGNITGTLSNQTDLQAALDAKAGLTANTFTGTQTVTKTALGITPADALVGQNTTAATIGNQQVSPDIRLQGNGWKTNATAASRSVEFRQYVLPVQATTNPLGRWKLQSQINSGGWSDALDFDTTAIDGIAFPRLTAYGSLLSSVNNSSTIGTLQSFTLLNPTGSKIQVANKFGSTIKSGVTYNSDGTVEFKSAGGSYYFNTGSNIESQNYIVQIYSSGIFNAGLSANQGTVTAGTASTTPPATLTTYGSYGSKGQYKTANFTVDTTGQFFYCDASAASVCAGTPSTSCGSTPGGQSGCDARSAVGCSWSGGSCSAFDFTDQSTCESNSPCVWDMASCSAYSGDESTCSSTPGCFYNGSNDCSGFDEMTCLSTSGCTANPNNCGDVFFDEFTCNEQSGCLWNGVSCDGTYGFAFCSGTYASCDGTYSTGYCTGSYGFCSGAASCGNLGSSGACGAESGCTWTSGMTATLPAISSAAVAGGTDTTGPWVGIKNVGTTGNVTVTPASGDTIEWASSSLVVSPQPSPIPSQVPTNYVLLHPLVIKADCGTYINNQSSCTALSECSWTANTCGSYPDSGTCGTASGCFWNGDTCEGTYIGPDGTCSGLYTTSKKWMRW